MGGVRLVLVFCISKVALTMVAQIISVSLPRMVTSSSGPNLAVQTDPRCPRDQRYLQQIVYEAGMFRCCEIKLCSETRDMIHSSRHYGHDLMLTSCYPCPIHGHLPDWWKAIQACSLLSPVFYFFAMSVGGLLLCFGTRYRAISVAGFCICNGIAGMLSIFSASYIIAKLTSEPSLILSGSAMFGQKYNLDLTNVHFVPDLGFYFSLIGGIVSLATSGFFYIAARHASKSESIESVNTSSSNVKIDPALYESAIATVLRHSQQCQQQQQSALQQAALGNQAYCGSQAALVDLGFNGMPPDATTKVR